MVNLFAEFKADEGWDGMNAELYWAAGFIDGEGSWYANKIGKHSLTPRLVAGQVRIEPLERLKKALGGRGRISGPHARPGKRQPFYEYRLSSFRDGLWAAEALWPLLSGPKREQLVRVLYNIRDFYRQKE